MLGFIIRRLLGIIPMLVGITLVCFAVIHLAPGDPAQLMLDLDPNAKANAAMAEHVQSNVPVWQQYLRWVGQLVQGNLGTSLAPDGLPVAHKIMAALPVTLVLNITGMLLVLLCAVPLGVYMATRVGSRTDVLLTAVLYITLAMPTFWLALLGMQFLGVHLAVLPLAGMASFGAENMPFFARMADTTWHLTLPILVSVIGGVAGLARFVRSGMAEVIVADYMLTARAKGAKPARVLVRHGLRNALLPVITLLGLSVPGLIGGSVILESLFSLPGMGQLFFNASLMRDYPTLMGLLTIGAVLTLLGNLLADVAYALADPRIRLK
jgi:peptide/nickel transport system permease protein